MSESNLPFRRRTVLKATGVAGLTGGTLAGLGSASEDCTVTIDGPEGWNSMSLKKQLKEVENATKSYRKPENADADGYKNTGLLGCRHGFSYGKDDSFDDVVDPLNPDIITYLLTNKKLELGAVEYVVPAGCGEPDLFNDEGESWYTFGENQSLHVWVHEDNPDGVFAPRNPGFKDMPGCVNIPDPK